MSVFLKAIASVLEVKQIGLDDNFRDVPEWCSLKAFGLLVMMENDFSTPLTISDLNRYQTVRDLYREAFRTFISSLLGLKRNQITDSSTYGDFPEWDSVNHLRLVMESEKRFGVHYELERIPSIKYIDDFLQ